MSALQTTLTSPWTLVETARYVDRRLLWLALQIRAGKSPRNDRPYWQYRVCAVSHGVVYPVGFHRQRRRCEMAAHQDTAAIADLAKRRPRWRVRLRAVEPRAGHIVLDKRPSGGTAPRHHWGCRQRNRSARWGIAQFSNSATSVFSRSCCVPPGHYFEGDIRFSGEHASVLLDIETEKLIRKLDGGEREIAEVQPRAWKRH